VNKPLSVKCQRSKLRLPTSKNLLLHYALHLAHVSKNIQQTYSLAASSATLVDDAVFANKTNK
jgi:hypothetical protein